MGQIERARNEVESSGNTDDRLLALTGIAQWHASSGRCVPLDILREIETIALKSQSELLEWTALQLVSIDADLSIRLATRIQNADDLTDMFGLEWATQERCIFRIFQALTRNDPQDAVERAVALASDAQRFLAEVAIAESLLPHNIEIGVHHLSIAARLLKSGTHAEIARHALALYLLERIQPHDVTRFVPALDALNRLSPFYGVPSEPMDALDDRIAKDPQAWYKAAQSLPPGDTRDSIHLRLFLRHEFAREIVSDLTTDFCRILAGFEEPAAERELSESEIQDSTATDGPATTDGEPQSTSNDSEVNSPPPESREERIQRIMEGSSHFPASVRFYILLEHLDQAIVVSGGTQRVFILRVIAALSEMPQLSVMAATEAFGRALSRAHRSSDLAITAFFDL
ncbi:MAG: hypothetical protein IT307_20695, partial [Chloroflexi bacterium]|nr:hypothetical protein [Chloroflexota bacterium]